MEHSFIDQYSGLKSPIHKIDPRIKIIVFFGFILFVVFTSPASSALLAFYAALLLLVILLSKVPFVYILKRCAAVVPFVLLIALFSLAKWGFLIFFSILAKAVLSASCLIILVSTTKFAVLLGAFEDLRVPKVFTMIMSFMYRYIFILTDELMRMKRAKDARSVGGGWFFQIKTLSNMLGVLFIRAYERAERVYLAMCARGYDGEARCKK